MEPSTNVDGGAGGPRAPATAGVGLQWSRRRTSTERVKTSSRGRPRSAASMEPSTKVDGERARCGRLALCSRASMEPSTNVDGELRIEIAASGKMLASMEPSTNVDGEAPGALG